MDPDDGEVRYVGKSVNVPQRFRDHINQAKNGYDDHKCRWIRRLLRKGKIPSWAIIDEVAANHWPDRERYWIAFYREEGHRLTNYAEGGEGGHKFSDITRHNMSQAHIGKPWSDARRKAYDPAKNKGGASLKGRKIGPLSEEHKTNLKKAWIKRKERNGQ